MANMPSLTTSTEGDFIPEKQYFTLKTKSPISEFGKPTGLYVKTTMRAATGYYVRLAADPLVSRINFYCFSIPNAE